MRSGSLLLSSFVVLCLAVANEASAGVPEQNTASVTVLRGSSAPPPPVTAAPPPTVVVLRDVVYQPVYGGWPVGYYSPFLGTSFVGSSFFLRARQATLRPVVAPAPVPNGWPLLGTFANTRR